MTSQLLVNTALWTKYMFFFETCTFLVCAQTAQFVAQLSISIQEKNHLYKTLYTIFFCRKIIEYKRYNFRVSFKSGFNIKKRILEIQYHTLYPLNIEINYYITSNVVPVKRLDLLRLCLSQFIQYLGTQFKYPKNVLTRIRRIRLQFILNFKKIISRIAHHA